MCVCVHACMLSSVLSTCPFPPVPRIVETTSTTMEEPQPAEETETAEQEAETAEQEEEDATKEQEDQPAAVVTDGDGDGQAMETGGDDEEKKEDGETLICFFFLVKEGARWCV